MKRCLIYSFIFGSAATLAMFFSAAPLGNYVIADARSIRSLRILAPSLLPLAMSSGIYGYLHAVRRVIKSASAQITEQVIRIIVTVAALSVFLPKGLEFGWLCRYTRNHCLGNIRFRIQLCDFQA